MGSVSELTPRTYTDDNLLSNELSFRHDLAAVVSKLRQAGRSLASDLSRISRRNVFYR